MEDLLFMEQGEQTELYSSKQKAAKRINSWGTQDQFFKIFSLKNAANENLK
jgi:hypothetical protein